MYRAVHNQLSSGQSVVRRPGSDADTMDVLVEVEDVREGGGYVMWDAVCGVGILVYLSFYYVICPNCPYLPTKSSMEYSLNKAYRVNIAGLGYNESQRYELFLPLAF